MGCGSPHLKGSKFSQGYIVRPPLHLEKKYFMCVSACMKMDCVQASCLWRSEEGIESHGTGVMDDDKLPCRYQELNSGPLWSPPETPSLGSGVLSYLLLPSYWLFSSFLFCFVIFAFVFQDKVSLHSLGCPGLALQTGLASNSQRSYCFCLSECWDHRRVPSGC